MSYSDAAVYWIRLQEHTDPNTQGYIGVSKNAHRRMRIHIAGCVDGTHYNPHLLNAVNKYGESNIVLDIILFGDEQFCYETESILRPKKGIGWNIAPGGHRGPGRPLGASLSKESIAKGIATRQKAAMDRAFRIKQNTPTEKDSIFIEQQRRIQTNNEVIRLRNLETADYLPEMRPICPICNKNFCAVNYIRAGVTHYRSGCDECGRKKAKLKPRKANWQRGKYRKKTVCDLCGFRSIYPSQLTVFHIDGNLENIEMANLRTICLCCIEVVKRKEVTWRRGDLIVD